MLVPQALHRLFFITALHNHHWIILDQKQEEGQEVGLADLFMKERRSKSPWKISYRESWMISALIH